MLFNEALSEVLLEVWALTTGAGVGAGAGVCVGAVFWLPVDCSAAPPAALWAVGVGLVVFTLVPVLLWLLQPAAKSATAAAANKIFLFPFNKEEMSVDIKFILIILA
jgi:hypothetical protein